MVTRFSNFNHEYVTVLTGNAIRYEQDTAQACVLERELDTIVKSILSRLQRLRVAFLLLKVYKNDQKIKNS